MIKRGIAFVLAFIIGLTSPLGNIRAKAKEQEIIYGDLPPGFAWVYDAPEEYFLEDLNMSKQAYVDMLCGTSYAKELPEATETDAPVDEEELIEIVPNEVTLLMSSGALDTINWADVKWWSEACALGTSYGVNGVTTEFYPPKSYGWACAGYVASVIYQFYDSDIIYANNTAAVATIDSFCASSDRFSYIGGFSVSNGSAYYSLCDNGTIQPGDVLVFSRDGDYKHTAIAGDKSPSVVSPIDGVYYMYHALNSTVGTVVTTGGYYFGGDSDKTGNYVKVYRVVEDVKGSVSLSKTVDSKKIYDDYHYSYVGCEYTVYDSSNQAVGVFKIEADGRGKVTSSSYGGLGTYYLTELPKGTYTVDETKVTAGLSKGSITIDGSNTSSFTISASHTDISVEGKNTLNRGSINLVKRAANGATNFDLSGATYNVYYENKTLVGSFVTNKQGTGVVTYSLYNGDDVNTTKLSKLPYGSYYVKETKGPDSNLFLINEANKNVTFSDANINVTITDDEIYSPYMVKLKKKSSDENVSKDNPCYDITGTTYTIYEDYACSKVAKAYKADGSTFDALLVCDKNGDTETLSMKKGTYYAKETKTGKGFSLDTRVYPITLTDEHRSTPYVLNVADKPQMDPIYELLYKADADEPDTYKIEGATFLVKFYAGDYKEGVDPESQGVPCTREWLFKTDANGRVKFTDNKEYFISGDEFYRNSAGIIMLPLGTVTIKEQSTPVEYILDETVFVRKITPDGVLEEVVTYNEPTIPNKVKRQAFQIMKFGETSTPELNPLANAGFMAANVEDLEKDANGNYIWDASKAVMLCDINHTPDDYTDDVKELFTDSNGYALSAKLRYGTYLVHETTVPRNFKAIKDFTVTIDHDSEVPQETRYFVDEIVKSYLRIYKVDAVTKQPILMTNGNVRFKIYSYDDERYVSFKTYENGKFVNISEFTINNDGYVITPGVLVAGDYRLEEYETLDEYYCPVENGFLDFTIDEDTVFERYVDEDGNETDAAIFTVRVENAPLYGEIKVEKYGEYDELINGEYVRKDVPLKDIEFSIYAAEDIYSNDKQGSLLYSKDEYLYSIVTDEEGIAKSNRNLPIGKYYLVEQNTPDDYFEGDIVPFSISTDGKIEVVDLEDGTRLMYIHEEVEVINYKKITTLEISKQDATTSDEVEGATLKLYDSSGNLIETWVSTKEKHVIKNLYPGEYTLVEEMAPNGYVVSNEVTFTIEHTSKVKKVTMYDEEVTGKLHVIKVDGYNKKPLSGVSFMLFKKSDTVIDSGIDQYLTKKWESEMDKEIINAHKQNLSDLYVGSYVTDENGEFTTEKLMYGEYYVVETLAKDGYFLVKDPVGFSIETKDQIVELTIENEGKEGRIDVNSMPNTPGNGNGHYPKTGDRSPIMLITMIMLMAGGMLLLLKKKKKKIMSLAVVMMLGVSVSNIPAFAAEQKTYTETKTDTYDSDDESTYDFSFEKEIEIDGTKYELDHITYEKEEKTSIKEGVEVTVKKEYEEVEKDFTAPKTITYEGISYELLDEKVTESGDGSLYLYYYDETDYQSEKPDHKDSVEYVYHDEASGMDYTVKLPYARTELVESNYAIPVTFSGTVTGYDAAYIVIGDYKIENPGENLLLDDAHISTILESIGVNPADYSDLKVYYTGEAYLNEEGMLCRDYEIRALMFGSKYRIYYEDNVKGLVKTYTCEANYGLGDKLLEEFTTVSYDVSAKATYYEVLEEDKSFFETLPGKAVLAGSIILGITVILALFIYLLKGGRKDTDYKTRADARKDYKKLNQKNR